MQSEITERAKTAWNSIADEFNQWDALGLDEQETYVALTAALSDKQAAEVKALEWQQAIRNGAYLAHGIGILYAVDEDHECAVLAKHEGSSVTKSAHANAESAKAAAQADYEQRIRSALVDVQAVEPGEWHRSVGTMGSTLLYTLREDGWRRGKPILVNDVTVRIERANGSKTDIEPIVRLIHAVLAATRSGSATNSKGSDHEG